MNECIFMSTQTRVCEHIQSPDTAACALILVIPVQGIFSKTTHGLSLASQHDLRPFARDLRERWQCVLIVVSLSKKTPDTDAICIRFQTERRVSMLGNGALFV